MTIKSNVFKPQTNHVHFDKPQITLSIITNLNFILVKIDIVTSFMDFMLWLHVINLLVM
jgi:hypothetical protein